MQAFLRSMKDDMRSRLLWACCVEMQKGALSVNNVYWLPLVCGICATAAQYLECMQAVRRALDEIVLKKRPPALPPKVPKLKNIQPLEPPRPGQRQLELVFVHECRSASSLALMP